MLLNNLKIALRNLYRNRSYATLNTLGLGLSIACCVLIFLLVQHHLGIDGYHAKADRTVLITAEATWEDTFTEGNVPASLCRDLKHGLPTKMKG